LCDLIRFFGSSFLSIKMRAPFVQRQKSAKNIFRFKRSKMKNIYKIKDYFVIKISEERIEAVENLHLTEKNTKIT
jgi:hypothetical protein